MLMFRFHMRSVVFMIAVLSVCAGGEHIAFAQDLVPAGNRPVRSIVIDPGHGGYDSGAIGPEGTTEKDVTLALARLTASALESRYRVLLTRTGDYQVGVGDRIAMANRNQADLFLSLHVGGGFFKKKNGVTVYFLDAAAGQSRNDSSFSLKELSSGRPFVVWDEAHYGHHRLCRTFANLLEDACRKIDENPCRIKSDRVAVLQGADMPAVMVEIGCLADPSWEKQFRDPDRLVVLSDMICEAIDRFFQPE